MPLASLFLLPILFLQAQTICTEFESESPGFSALYNHHRSKAAGRTKYGPRSLCTGKGLVQTCLDRIKWKSELWILEVQPLKGPAYKYFQVTHTLRWPTVFYHI